MLRAVGGDAGAATRRERRAGERAPLEGLLWHPAGLGVLHLKVWATIRRGGPMGVTQAAERVGAHRVHVGRAVARLREAGLLAGSGEQPRNGSTQAFGKTLYVALDPPEEAR